MKTSNSHSQPGLGLLILMIFPISRLDTIWLYNDYMILDDSIHRSHRFMISCLKDGGPAAQRPGSSAQHEPPPSPGGQICPGFSEIMEMFLAYSQVVRPKFNKSWQNPTQIVVNWWITVLFLGGSFIYTLYIQRCIQRSPGADPLQLRAFSFSACRARISLSCS